MIIIIDGTGDEFIPFPGHTEEYRKNMGKSFCSRLADEVNKKGRYFRGPSATGVEVDTIAGKALEAARSAPAEQPLFLCGFSRGGLIAIDVARRLRSRPVKALFLFDAVDRAVGMTGDKVTDNVKTVYHAHRNPSFTRESVKETRTALEKANDVYAASRNRLVSAFLGPDPKVVAPVRERINAHAVARNANYYARNEMGASPGNFGKAGVEVGAATTLEAKAFDGSHGALGGVPWLEDEVKGDHAASREVQTWMWARFFKEGVLSSAPAMAGG